MILMAHTEYGIRHFSEGHAEDAKKAGWFVVDSLSAAKAKAYGKPEKVEATQDQTDEPDKPRRGRPPKAQ